VLNAKELMSLAIEKGASDLHLNPGRPPVGRMGGKLTSLIDEALDDGSSEALARELCNDAQWEELNTIGSTDFGVAHGDGNRFRASVFRQRGRCSAVLRLIPSELLSFEQIGVPEAVQELLSKPRGLILVTGPTGSGKTTTLATLIDWINANSDRHIITIEDPIEFVHNHKKCIVNQREIGSDTNSYRDALRYVLRQDPDVVLIGEIRDHETMEATLRIAETGHLALATLHTNTAVQTIHRVLDFFPADQQEMVRTQLSFVLEGVISQQLIPREDGAGRVLGVEVLFPNAAVRNLIREEKTHQIYSQMQMGQGKHGMQTLNQSLLAHVRNNAISVEEALHRSYDRDELNQMLQNWQQETATAQQRSGKRTGSGTSAFDRRRR